LTDRQKPPTAKILTSAHRCIGLAKRRSGNRSGKSIIAMNLAVGITHRGCPTLFVDIDPQPRSQPWLYAGDGISTGGELTENHDYPSRLLPLFVQKGNGCHACESGDNAFRRPSRLGACPAHSTCRPLKGVAMSSSLTQEIFQKVSVKCVSTKAVFKRPEAIPVRGGKHTLPAALGARIDATQLSLVRVGSGLQMACSVAELLVEGQNESFHFPDVSLLNREIPAIIEAAEKFYGGDRVRDYPAMFWTIPLCFSDRWVLAKHGANSETGSSKVTELKEEKFRAFKGNDLELPVRDFKWASPSDRHLGFVTIREKTTGSVADGTLVSSNRRSQIGRGAFSREYDQVHARGHHAAQEERAVNDASGIPCGLLDVQLLKFGRLVPRGVDSDGQVQDADIHEITFALDRDTARLIYIATSTDAFTDVYAQDANASAEATAAIYRPFLES
jgi:hypothetical protein